MEGQIFGRITITVHKGSGLAPKSVNGKSNPFCTLTCDKRNPQKTKKQLNTLDPLWEQQFSFNINNPFELVEIIVTHDNSEERVQLDNFMGRTKFSISNFADQQPHDLSLQLEAREMKDEVTGSILVTVQYKYTREWEDIYTAMELLKKRDFQGALATITRAIEKMPNISQLFGIRSEAYLNLNQFKNAMADAAKAMELNPNLSESHYYIGRVYEQAGKIEQAEAHYKNGLSLNKKDPLIIEAMKRIDRRLELSDGSGSKRSSELPSGPIEEVQSDPSSELRQLFDKKDYQGAIDILSRSIRSDASNFSLYVGRAICQFGKMNIAAAQEDALKAAEVNPKWPKNNPTKEGWIKKGGHINRNKKKRYFILQSLFLFYYKSREDSAPQGVIPIYRSSIMSEGDKKLKIVVLSRGYRLYFETKDSLKEWHALFNELSNSKFLELPRAIIIPRTLQKTSSFKSFKRLSMVKDRLSKLSTTVYLDSRDGETKTGILYKTGQLSKHNYKKRFFILKDKQLYYFESEPLQNKNIEALGVISLADASWKKGEADPMNPGRHCFEIITPLRTYYLFDTTQQEMLSWKEAIENCNGESIGDIQISKQTSPADVKHNDEENNNNNNNYIENFNVNSTSHSNNNSNSNSNSNNNNSSAVHESLDDLASFSVNPKQSDDRLDVTYENVLNMKHSDPYGSQKYDDFEITEVKDTNSNPEINQLNITQMSNSESKFFKKFGLEPPSENKRKSVLVNPNAMMNNSGNNYNPYNPNLGAAVPSNNNYNYSSGGSNSSSGNLYDRTLSDPKLENPSRLPYSNYSVDNNNNSNLRGSGNNHTYNINVSANAVSPPPVEIYDPSSRGSIQGQEQRPLLPPRNRPPPPKDDCCCCIS